MQSIPKLERQFTATAYILKDNQVLLIFHPKHLKWLPPGGHLEPHELPSEAAKREVLEETGLEIEFLEKEPLKIDCWNATSFPRPFLCLLENIPPFGTQNAHQHIDFVYLARPTGGTEIKELMAQGLLRWFSLEEVQKLETDREIFGETQQAIEHILSNFS